jgi:hypothetical protein
MSGKVKFIEGGEINEARGGSGRRDVEVTVIKAGPGNPVNNHYYSAEMLEAHAHIFAGNHIYADHENDPTVQRKRGGVRSTKDLVGVIRETWWDAEAKEVKGTATILRDWVWEIVEADPSVLGLSISGTAGKITQRKIAGAVRNIVESIRESKSVDLVTRAGAGGKINRILESMQEDIMALEAITLDDLKEHRSDLIEAAMAEVTKDAPATLTLEEHEANVEEAVTAAVTEAKAEAVKETEARITAEREAAERLRENTAAVTEALAEAKLPTKTEARIKRDFEKLAEGDTPTDELREALQSAIKEAKEELAEAAGSGEIKGMGGAGGSLEESGKSGATKPAGRTGVHAQVMRAIAPDTEA